MSQLPPATDDPRVVDALEQSVLIRACSTVLDTMWHAAEASRVAEMANQAIGWWTSHRLSERRTSIGIAAMTGAAVHVALVAAQQPPPGWLWLVLPALAATTGAMLALWPAATHD